MLTDEEIIGLFRNPKFKGSFSGMKNFQLFLKTDLNEIVSLQRLYNVMKNYPNYIYQLRPIRKFPTRNYVTDSFGELMEIDLGFMPVFNLFRYFLCLVDVFSWHIWCVALRKKSGPVVGKALEKIFDEIKSPITKIQADSGTEFIGNKNVFVKHKILFKTKHLKNKAAMAEHAIYLVKRKLYMIMRSEKSKNWVKYLPVAVKLLNDRPVKRIGNLAPGSINSMFDDVKVRNAQKLQKNVAPEEPTWRQQNTLQTEYEKSPGFQKDDFVYLDYKEKTFAKSFDLKISILIKIPNKYFLILAIICCKGLLRPNNIGGGGLEEAKKCHVFFEWPLTTAARCFLLLLFLRRGIFSI